MAKKISGFTIKEVDLAKALEISHEKLREIAQFFDSDPNDSWELVENKHFIYLVKCSKERLFSEEGAYAIAKYMDENSPKNLWQTIIEFITKHKEKIRNAFISRKILDNSDSLVFINSRHFLSKKDIISILCTSPARLNKAFEELQKSEDMQIYVDFEDFEVDKKTVRYYSFAGFFKIARNLGQALTIKDRRGWCGAIEVVGKKTFKMILSEQEAQEKKIQSAMGRARKYDKNTCQITGEISTVPNSMNITAHHIYSKQHYPQLATSVDNLITLKESIHKDFHCWNKGFDKPCTADDLMRFATELYPENYEVIQRLKKVKGILGSPVPKQKSSIKSITPEQN